MSAKNFIIAVFLLLLFAIPAFGQNRQALPDAPKPAEAHKAGWIFRTEVIAISTSAFADAFETHRALRSGSIELNPILGQHPSDVRLALTDTAITLVQILAVHYAEKNPHPVIRWAGRLYAADVTENHTRLTVCALRSIDCGYRL
jgi:hypothetical protein